MPDISQIVLKDSSGNVIGTYDVKDATVPHTSEAAASGGTTLSLVTTGEKAAWNAKASTDTKNTAGSTNNTSDFLYLVGSTSQGANPQTYSNSNLYAKNGLLSTQGSVVRNASGKTRVYDYTSSDHAYITMYNSSDKYTISMGGQKGLINIYDASQNRRGVFWVGGNNDGVLDLYNSSGTSTISLTGQNGNVKCTTINSYHPISCTFGNETKSFTSTTTLTYTGKSVSCPAGRRKLVRAWFRYVNNAPVEYAVSTANNSVGSYLTACIAYGKDGGYGCPCLTFVVNGGETLYYFARYTGVGSNRIDETTIEYFTL